MNNPNLPVYGGRMSQQSPPAPVNSMPDLESEVQAQIDAAVAKVEEKYAERIAALEEQAKAAHGRVPASGVAEHAAGPGYEVAPTWGLWHQELSRAGQLTDDVLKIAGIVARAV